MIFLIISCILKLTSIIINKIIINIIKIKIKYFFKKIIFFHLIIFWCFYQIFNGFCYVG